MTTHEQIVRRYAQQAGTVDAQLSFDRSGNVFVDRSDLRTLYSYGHHFPLSRIMPDESGQRSWWLLNGDRYSVATTRHQALVRDAVESTGLPALTVPFTALRQAGIDLDTIRPVDITKERYDEVTRYAATLDDVPAPHRPVAVQVPDGGWQWNIYRHWLGASLFTATYHTRQTGGTRVTRTASFLSAFDEQENRPHYFLCELPPDAHPSTVGEAFEALKPREVTEAEQQGRVVTRQGDLFAVPIDIATRQVTRLGGQRQHRPATVLGLNHTATEVAELPDGRTVARGVLYHRAQWGTPQHRRQPMGDRTTWHLLAKNTVPVDSDGGNRAWSRGGNVD